MRYLLTGAQMKVCDEETIKGDLAVSLELMERASLACVRYILDSGWNTSHVLILCGSGNNGGDGFAIGRILMEYSIHVSVYFAGNPKHCSRENIVQRELFEKAGGKIYSQSEPLDRLSFTIVVDALFGIGLARPVEGAYAELIRTVNQMRAKKLAVDIPSGISAGNGQILGTAFEADATITFQADKIGLYEYPGALYAGKVVTAPIGVDCGKVTSGSDYAYTLNMEDIARKLPKRPVAAHKGTFGKVLLIAGSDGMAGAAYLNALSIYRCGAGLVKIFTPRSNREVLQQLVPEAILSCYDTLNEDQLLEELDWADIVCMGSGLGMSSLSRQVISTVLHHTEKPCIIDADGLNILAENPSLLYLCKNHPVILTPHMKEFSRLLGRPLGEIMDNKLGYLKSFVDRYPVTAVLKDARTYVAKKGYPIYINITGNPAMAKAGAGDVLAGMITGLAAHRMDVYEASVCGVYIHGLAGDKAKDALGDYSVLARDLSDHIAKAFVLIQHSV